MFLLLHGATGGWDELAIAAVAVGVLWIAVKLAARKPAEAESEDQVDSAESPEETATERTEPAQPSTTKPG